MDITRASYEGVVEGVEACLVLARDPERLGISAPEVSAWTVHEQVEHLLLSDRGIVKWVGISLEEPEPAGRAGEPTETGRAALAAGSIPRGRGPAPDGTHPRGATPTELVEQWETLRARCVALGDRLERIDASRHTLAHHVLGHLTPAEWLRFLHIHHLHHASIIDDILA